MDTKAFSMRLPATLLAATLAALPAGAASAADLDYGFGSAPPPVVALPESKVEFGSGWYIRGDVGAAAVPKLQISNPSLESAPPAYTQWSGLQPGQGGLAFGGGSTVHYVGSLAAGYQVSRFFRGELMADIHQSFVSASATSYQAVFCPTAISYNKTNEMGAVDYTMPSYANGGCTGNYNGRVSSYDVLVNGYVDVGTWYGVTPYVGAGIGISFGKYRYNSAYTQQNSNPYHVSYTDAKNNATYYQNFDGSNSGIYHNFAFAGMAGFAIDIYPHTKLDIGYRYLNLGHIAAHGGTLYEHEARAGLRYMIDN